MKKLFLFLLALCYFGSIHAQFTSWNDLLEVYKSKQDARANVIMGLGFNFKNESKINSTLTQETYEKKMISGAQGEWFEYMTVVKGSKQVIFTTENTTLFDKLKKELVNDYRFHESANPSKNGEMEYIRDSSRIVFFSQMAEDNQLTKHIIKIIKYYHTDVQPLAVALNEPSSEESKTTEPQMRGGGDPLKGLNVSTSVMVKGLYYALIIGVDNYQGQWKQLKNAVNDAKTFESTLKSKYKIDNFNSLYDGQATREAIINAFVTLAKNVKEEDNLIIYYSGHGEFNQTLNTGYWVPGDAKTNSVSELISNNDIIQTYLASIKSKHTLLISDACFSGDIFRGNTIQVPFEESNKYYANVYNLKSRQALTSGGKEPVMDGGSDGHSVFSYYLLKNLKDNPNKYFDVGTIYSNMKVPIARNSSQTPRLDYIKNTGDEGGQFIFILK